MHQENTETNTSRESVMAVVVTGSFLVPFMASSINIALPTIGREFSMTALILSWVATSYLLAAAVFLIPFGRMADLYGRKRIFLGGTILYTAASLLTAIAPSASLLITFRIMHGIGSSMIFATGIAMLTSVFPPAQRGKVLGLNVSATYIGLSLGPVLGGLLTQYFGWRSIFFVNIPLGLLMMALVIWKIKGEWAGAKGETFDWGGSLVYGVSIILLMYGFSKLPHAIGFFLTFAGVFGIALFALFESRVEHPVFHIDLMLRNTAFAFSNIAALINYSATYAIGFLLSLYLQYMKGLDPRHAGLVLVAQPIIMAIGSPVAGRLSDRIEPRIVSSIGMGLTAFSLLLFSFVSSTTSVVVIIVELAVIGLGFSLFSSPNTNAVMASVDRRFYGIASATVGTMRLIGQMLSMGISMLVFALYVGDSRINAEQHELFLTAIRAAFLIFAILCAIGIFASLARGKVHTNQAVHI